MWPETRDIEVNIFRSRGDTNGSLGKEQAREYNCMEVLNTFSGKFLQNSRALLALCLLRDELSATSGFLRQMPYKHQSLVFSTVSQHWLS